MSDAGPTPAELARYALVTPARGARMGERTALAAGGSLEFLDARPYQPGDEPRHVDWRAYARTRRLTTRTYHAERAADVLVLFDDDAGMALHGKPAWLAALAWVLRPAARDEGRLTFVRASGPAVDATPGRGGNAAVARFLDALAARTPAEAHDAGRDAAGDGDEDVGTAGPFGRLARRLARVPRRGRTEQVLVLSDGLDPGPVTPLLGAVRARGAHLGLVRTLAPAERDPAPDAVELVDVEDGRRTPVDADDVERYRARLAALEARQRRAVTRAGHRLAPADVPADAATASPAALRRAALAAWVRTGWLQVR